MEFLKEFYEENKEWLTPLISSLIGAFVGWITSIFRTRSSRIEDLIDGKNIYDDNDLVYCPPSEKGVWIELGTLNVCRKGKNADENESKSS